MTWKVRLEQVGAISLAFVIKHDSGRYHAAPDGSLAMWWNRWEAAEVCAGLNRAQGIYETPPEAVQFPEV